MSDRHELIRDALAAAFEDRELDLTKAQLKEAMRQMEEIADETEEMTRKLKELYGCEPNMMPPWAEQKKSVKHKRGKEKKARRMGRRK